MKDLLLATAFVVVPLVWCVMPEILRRWDVARGLVSGRVGE